MITSNLFDTDPDKLFETSSIEEIQKVQVSIQHEIERKREELRTMVGERYRDLIEAADTIAEMKDISLNVIEDINKVSASTEEMHQKYILRQDVKRLKKSSFESTSTNKLDEIAVQMKVLISLPEQIWTFIDSEDYAKASQLYLLARHFKTGLEVQKFQCLLLDHQWEVIAQFKENILSAAKEMLKQQTLSSESACNCFLAIMMLENLDSKGLVARFLDLRSSALHQLLSVGDSFEDATAIKKRFVASHSLIVSTALVLCSCFIESDMNNHEGLLYQNARDITGRDAKPIISLLPDIQSDLLSAVTVHRILPDLTLDPVSPGAMAAAFEGWLVKVREFVEESGRNLLEMLNTLRSLQGLRKAYQTPSVEWGLALQRLMQPPTMDLWVTLYCPLIVERAKALISLHWSMGLEHIKTETIQFVNTADDSKCPETDLRWHVWKEEPRSDPTSDKTEKNNVWWLKSQGISCRVADMCRVLEDRLQLLTGDLAALCPEEEIDAGVLTDHNSLRTHQQQVCLNFVSKLTEFVRNEINKSEKEAILSLYARYLQIISKLCPSLQKCLTGLDFKTDSWQQVCSMLNENAEFAWTIWQQRVMTKLKPVIHTVLLPPKQLSDLLYVIPQWNVVEVEEIGESQQKIKSQLNVPASPSLKLLQILTQINMTLSRAFVPLYATELIVKDVVQEVMKLYEQCEILCPAHAWQHLFDLKYILSLLVSPENKSLQTICRESVEKIERSIDPFDLDVFAPYIQENVKKSIRETQLMFGVLCRPRMQTALPQPSAPGGANTANEDPSILALSQTGPSVWFRLLPVTAPSGTRAINLPKKAGKAGSSNTPVGITTESDVSAKTTLTNAATSFFGSVTADWFGSS